MPTGSIRCEADGVPAGYSIIGMLGVAVLAALACLAATRPRQVLRLAVAISTIELGFAAHLWVAVFAAGRVTAADDLFFVDAFSAFHLAVLALVFLLCSLFAGIYFADERDGHAFSIALARRFGALWIGS